MPRSICYCERNFVLSGEVSTWNFYYTTGVDLSKNASIRFDLNSKGRPDIDWEIPQTNLNIKKNLIWGILPNGKVICAKKIDNSIFEFILPVKIQAGKNFTISIGTPTKKTTIQGNRAQTFNQRKRKFLLKIDPKGKGDFKISELFNLDIRGNVFCNLKTISPSFVSRNKRFDIMLRFEDKYGNLTGNAEEGTLINLTYKNLRENLNWKLFVPETGFMSIPNLYFNEPGIYRLKFKNLKTKEEYISQPIKCFENILKTLIWGSFHSESVKYNATNNIDNFLREARDEKGFGVVGSSPFDSQEETPYKIWKNIAQSITEFNEEFRFIPFLGFQWVGIPKEEGIRQFIYLKDNKNLLRFDELKTNSLKKIYKSFMPKDFISVPIFSMNKKSGYDFSNYNEEFERVIEIYNAWGSSECLEKEDNLKPIKGNLTSEFPNGSIRKALSNNCRFGFIAGGYDDRGVFESYYNSNQKQYSPGLTAIIADNQTREDIFAALKKRSCYATTGARIVLDFNIANQPMGSELNIQDKPGLELNRYITSFVIGTDIIKKVEIIRNGKVFKSYTPNELSFEFNLNDDQLFKKIYIQPKNDSAFAYYYVRVQQNDGHVAWSSPIWIDEIERIKKSRIK